MRKGKNNSNFNAFKTHTEAALRFRVDSISEKFGPLLMLSSYSWPK